MRRCSRSENKKTLGADPELVPNQMQIFDVFRLEKDYHNLKAAVKESCIGGIHPGYYAEETGQSRQRPSGRHIEESDYDALPKPMREVAQDGEGDAAPDQ